MDRARRNMSNLRNHMQEEEEHDMMFQNATLLMLNDGENNQGGSRTGRAPNIDRSRIAGHQRIWDDYFCERPVYNDNHFRRRFRMSKSIFFRIEAAVKEVDDYFVQKTDALGVLGLSSIQKTIAAIRMLAYGNAADSLDEYVHMGETTAIECLKRFCMAIVNVFKEEYLRSPNVQDIERILHHSMERGFPRMIGSIDCMHWTWKNCPRAWAGQYQGRHDGPTIILEAVASYDLWIWHAFFGMSGSNNDLNVLERSHLFHDQIHGVAPQATFMVNGKAYHQTYMLADGIYPKWPTFVQTISDPQGEKRKYFAMMQESCRKDVERAFGVLQSRWAIVREPARLWSDDALHSVMITCIILHNMIVEDERNDPILGAGEFEEDASIVVERGQIDYNVQLPSVLLNIRRLRSEEKYLELRNDLIEHLWFIRGNQ